MTELICYCFEYTESDIRDDIIRNHGKSLLLKRILEARKHGNCQCDIENPKGT